MSFMLFICDDSYIIYNEVLMNNLLIIDDSLCCILDSVIKSCYDNVIVRVFWKC